MATNFPASLDSLTNPTSSDSLSSPSHSAQHANVNDAVEALQAKVGADSSAVTSSLDYKVAQLEAISHGKILQVVTSTYSTEESTTSTSFVDTSLTATITPSSATSKVLVLTSFVARSQTTGAYEARRTLHAISRGGTDIINQHTTGYYDQQGTTTRENYSNAALIVLDSPATTSATTYTLQHAITGTATCYTFNNRLGTMTLMEVSA